MSAIYEPINLTRKIIGFDTFEGFPSVDKKDGNDDVIGKGAFSVTPDYQSYLEKVLDYHEQESPISHIKKYELRKGDATVEIEKYLTENPQTIVALAYFDFDVFLRFMYDFRWQRLTKKFLWRTWKSLHIAKQIIQMNSNNSRGPPKSFLLCYDILHN